MYYGTGTSGYNQDGQSAQRFLACARHVDRRPVRRGTFVDVSFVPDNGACLALGVGKKKDCGGPAGRCRLFVWDLLVQFGVCLHTGGKNLHMFPQVSGEGISKALFMTFEGTL